jgi:hypothetical protein
MLIEQRFEREMGVGHRAVKREVSILQLLEWAFRVEYARLDLDDVASMAGFTRPNVGMEYIMIERARLGCQIDGGGQSVPHSDADVVASALAVLPEAHGGRTMAIAIAEMSRAGLMPDWMDGAVTKCVPLAWRQHKYGRFAKTEVCGVIEYTSRKGKRRREITWCPVTYTPTASQIGAAHRFYLKWWGALLDLQATFRLYGGLSGHEVTDAMPPMAPWRDKSI